MPCGSEGGGDEAPRLPGRKRECTVRPATKRWSALGVIMGFAVPALLLLAAPLEAGAGKSFEMLAGTVALPMAFRWLVFEDLPIMQGWELLILAAAALNALALLVLHVPRDAALRAAAPRWRSARYTAWAARGRMQRRAAHARGAARLPRPRPCAASGTGMHGGRGPAGRRPSLLQGASVLAGQAGTATGIGPRGAGRGRGRLQGRMRNRLAGFGPLVGSRAQAGRAPARASAGPARGPCGGRVSRRLRRPCGS